MPRKWEVEFHPQRQRIVKALIKGQSLRDIAGRFGISKSALSRYLNKKLLPAVAREQARKELRDVGDFLKAVGEAMDRVQKMYDACDEYLQDPDDPSRYYLGPRAEEVEVAYLRQEEGQTFKLKDNLYNLLEKALQENQKLIHVKWKHADPRKLLLDTALTLNKQLELLAKIRGMVQDIQINIQNMPVWVQLKQLILDATAGHPDVRKSIADAFLQLAARAPEGSGGGS